MLQKSGEGGSKKNEFYCVASKDDKKSVDVHQVCFFLRAPERKGIYKGYMKINDTDVTICQQMAVLRCWKQKHVIQHQFFYFIWQEVTVKGKKSVDIVCNMKTYSVL